MGTELKKGIRGGELPSSRKVVKRHVLGFVYLRFWFVPRVIKVFSGFCYPAVCAFFLSL